MDLQVPLEKGLMNLLYCADCETDADDACSTATTLTHDAISDDYYTDEPSILATDTTEK